MSSDLGARAIGHVRRRVLPLIVLLYFVSYLDRNNVGFAQLDMKGDIGLSSTAFGFGAGMFFIGYALVEIPSNAAMHRFGARRWICRILVTWGIIAAAMALVQGPVSFAVVRFLLGVAEAGFFPAILLYLTYWFPADRRVEALGIFILAQPLSNAIGAPISGLLLDLDGTGGLAGWQWLFIFEGLPAVILGILVPFMLTDRPADAAWLGDDERDWLVEVMADEGRRKKATADSHFMAGLLDRRVWVYAALYFGLVFGIYGLGLWLPTIVDQMGDFSGTQVGFIVAVPYVIAAGFVYLWSRHSDRAQERSGHATASLALGGVGLIIAGYLLDASPIIAMVGLTVAAMGIYSAISPLLEMPSAALAGAAAASGLALVNSLGNLAGFVSPYAVGWLADRSGDNRSGLLLMAVVLLVTAVATFGYGRHTRAGRVPAPAD